MNLVYLFHIKTLCDKFSLLGQSTINQETGAFFSNWSIQLCSILWGEKMKTSCSFWLAENGTFVSAENETKTANTSFGLKRKRKIRSISTNQMDDPISSQSLIIIIYENRSFCFSAPSAWNFLPKNLHDDSLSGFKGLFKTDLFCFSTIVISETCAVEFAPTFWGAISMPRYYYYFFLFLLLLLTS